MNNAVIIGGGFYGTSIAIYLAKKKSFKSVTLIEREKDIHLRASSVNQARVHMGYHYPRSISTAFRSKINLPKFLNDWNDCIISDNIHLYAISEINSKITTKQYEKFCKKVGINIEDTKDSFKKIFNPRLIKKIYAAEEYVFNVNKIIKKTRKELLKNKVNLLLNSEAKSILEKSPNEFSITIQDKEKSYKKLKSRYVFNCTYSDINQFFKVKTSLKHEFAEIALVKVPKQLRNIGITIMDGPFFSLMPYPSEKLHSLTHVRYTPHYSWIGNKDDKKSLKYKIENTRISRMIRDSKRYVPLIEKSNYFRSLYEVKTVSLDNENDDGRPIIFEKDKNSRVFSILGGKIDNIYDVFSKLDEEFL